MEALETLASVMRDVKTPASARVSAASAILDRGHGKAPQHIETENITSMTDAELERLMREFAADMRAMGLGHLLDAEEDEPDDTGDKKEPAQTH